MNYIIFLKMVPDVVEELKIADDGKKLDDEWLRLKLNECDEHALEEAVILKEKFGGSVIVVGLDSPEIDEALFNGLAKGADHAVKIIGEWQDYRSPAIARVYADFLSKKGIKIDSDTLILCGSQAIDDLEGETIFYLSKILNLPVNGVVTSLTVDSDQNKATFMKEFSGGLRGQFEVTLPAIFGIQAAENPPRYIPIAKMRAVMKTSTIEEYEIPPDNLPKPLDTEKMYEPETSGKAEMIGGSPDEIVNKIIEILTDKAII